MKASNASAVRAERVQRGVCDAPNVSRRHFLVSGASVGLTALALRHLSSCGGGDDDPPCGRRTRARSSSTSHENYAGKTYLTGGGRRFTLTPTADRPEVFAHARQTFLRAVPDDQITHTSRTRPSPATP
jgi:hypothetical protein